MGCTCKSAPAAPDPVATAQAQNSVNAEAIANAAKYNRTNQVTPFGSQTYSGTPGSADDTLTQTLSPELQKLLTGQTQISQGLTDQANTRLGQIPSDPFSIAGAPGVRQNQAQTLAGSFDQGGPLQYGIQGAGPVQSRINTRGVTPINTDFSGQLNSSRNAAYDSQAQYLDPRFKREDQALSSQLAAQGIPVGSEAYNNAMAQAGETKNQAYQGAQDSATLAGNQLQNQLFGQNLSANQTQFGQAATQGQFGNQAQQQLFGQNAQQQQANNAAVGQAYGQNMGAADFANNAASGNFDQNQALRGNDVQDRQQNINENVLQRNQGFNELAAFLNGSPISPTQPAFANTPTYNAAQGSPDAVGLAAQNYAAAQQSRSGLLSSLFGAAGKVGGAAAAAGAFCWVAREVYGADDPRWLRMRAWMLTKAPDALRAFYLHHGEQIAKAVSGDPDALNDLRTHMDGVLAHV